LLKITELQDTDVDDEFCALVAEWRNRSLKFFFDQRRVDAESARSYLESKIVTPGSRFFTVRLESRIVGHVGIKNITATEGELDNLMVGTRVAELNVADAMEKFMIHYAKSDLGLERLRLNLLSHNVLIKRLHEANDFRFVSTDKLHESIGPLGRVLLKCLDNSCDNAHSLFRSELWHKEL
jgi:RimJ/RimL family protein N-acetyltransferase